MSAEAASGEPRNVYDDEARAESYAGLELPGTYHLAYRDLPELLAAHVRGRRALDFGCGTGRSTRFLRDLGFDALGVDVAEAMLVRARERDPTGDYQLVGAGRPSDLEALGRGAFDLVLAAFTFDNVPTRSAKVELFRALGALLGQGGRIVTVVSAPEIYLHEWTSFSTRGFPENRTARSGDTVRITMLDVPDRRPVEDVLCTDADYRRIHGRAGLEAIEVRRPLGREEEPLAWVSETRVAPWVVSVLGRRGSAGDARTPPAAS